MTKNQIDSLPSNHKQLFKICVFVFFLAKKQSISKILSNFDGLWTLLQLSFIL